MASLLARVKQNESATNTTSTPDPTSSPSGDNGSNALTGSNEAALSDQVMGVLVMMQMGSASGASSSAGATSPIDQAFAGLDTDGDGSLSQSELETAIGNAGGSKDEADAMYSALGGTSSAGISQANFAQAAQAGAPQPGGMHGHHHHHKGGGAGSAGKMDPSQLFSSLDTDQDGSVSEDEFATALASIGAGSSMSSDGAKSASTDDLFSAIDSNGDGSASQNEFSSYLTSLQQQAQNDRSLQGDLWKLAQASYKTGSGASGSASQSLTA
jgi:Ca2+-binding EF-hand superfamily protein